MAGELNHTGELLVTAGSGKGLWCRTRPCGALGDDKLRRARGVRSRVRGARKSGLIGIGDHDARA